MSAVDSNGGQLYSALYEKRDVGGFILSGALTFAGYQTQFDQALALYQRALVLKPGDVDAHVNRARLELLLGDFANTERRGNAARSSRLSQQSGFEGVLSPGRGEKGKLGN